MPLKRRNRSRARRGGDCTKECEKYQEEMCAPDEDDSVCNMYFDNCMKDKQDKGEVCLEGGKRWPGRSSKRRRRKSRRKSKRKSTKKRRRKRRKRTKKRRRKRRR